MLCRAGGVAVVAGLLVPLAACGGDQTPREVAGGEPAASAAGLPQSSDPVELDPGDFTADITNRYWPMEPGTRWTYRELGEDGEEQVVVVTVSSETRKIANGVTARVVRDSVTLDGELIEDTLDWYAQDRDGTVWYLGEDTAEFEGGEITTRGGSFEAGVDGALPGVIMPAEPEVGQAYRQEYYAGEAEDNGEVLSTEEMADTRAGHYEDVVLTKDTITIEPDVLEYKLYAPDVGPVLVFGVSGGAGREELVSVTRVPDEVARAAGTAPLGSDYG
ncbi:hypothetical protein [Nocardioides donggukensis]|uniref:DUF3068 domain-containing protein n=1 Tax=Nocardioides donggukensis TaxID=2774019 RepID=A0A927Q085_9ACTN|nr:hypothetical protein [Nocardioides donggukensis]MBD8870315.1 hypothetical protein [Nocardioides donggukensis]